MQDLEQKVYGALKLSRDFKATELADEIEILKTLEHPNIVSVSATCVAKGFLIQGEKVIAERVTYCIMPLAGKGDLGGYLKSPEHHMSEDMAAFFFA